MKNEFMIVVVILLTTLCAGAQTFPKSEIPDHLIENADAVVRLQETFVSQTDLNNATLKYTEVITVLNQSGKDFATIIIPQDKFTELRSFSGSVIDPENGKIIKKITKNDLFTTAYSSHFATDDKYSVYKYNPSVYPFTIKYEYEVRLKNGIPAYPRFSPVTGYNLSVQKATYRIQIPEDFEIRYKCCVCRLKNLL